MNHTKKHVAAGVAWFLLAPLVALALFTVGGLRGSGSTAASLIWGLGVVGIFCSWALVDARSHGKATWVALIFTAAWFVVFAFAVFPYLFVTRGARSGLVASLKFLCLCVALGIVWVGVLPLLGRLM